VAPALALIGEHERAQLPPSTRSGAGAPASLRRFVIVPTPTRATRRKRSITLSLQSAKRRALNFSRVVGFGVVSSHWSRIRSSAGRSPSLHAAQSFPARPAPPPGRRPLGRQHDLADMGRAFHARMGARGVGERVG
jgi:hypothetical protein